MDFLFEVLAVAHLGLAATWLGSMMYSLVIVQPRAHRFFGADDDTLEGFLALLGAGNRRPVVAIIAGLLASGFLMLIVRPPSGGQVAGYALEGLLLLAAALVFVRVSWQLWPARVFALPDERPGHRALLRRHAVAMILLVGTAFVVAVVRL